jgi:hypothetical protein
MPDCTCAFIPALTRVVPGARNEITTHRLVVNHAVLDSGIVPTAKISHGDQGKSTEKNVRTC